MKKLTLFITFLLIVNITYSQNFQKNLLQDSTIQIPYKFLVSANQSYILNKFYRKERGLYQEQLHSKDVVIQYYERVYSKCRESDSINTLILSNKDLQLVTALQMYKEQKREKNIQKVKTIVLSTVLPILTALAGLGIGHYIPF